jgi:hypothetical protein
MATLQEEKNMLDALEKNLEVLSGITPESLVRKEELGVSLSFEEGLPSFRRTLKLFNDLKNANKDGVPYNTLNELNNLAVNCIEEFKKVKEFSMDKYPQNPVNSRDSLITTVRDRYDEYYKKLTPHIAYSIRKGTDFEALESQARETLTELIKTKNEIIKEQEKAKNDSSSILESMRKAAAEAGVSQHAIYFKEEADQHNTSADKWLKATYISAGVTIVFALVSIIFYFSQIKDLTIPQTIQLAITKILVFSVLYYATVWCGKNYRSHLHNYITNKHRQNSLSTFQAFVKASDDPQTKNAVLLRATEAIFIGGQSGFVSNEQESSGTPQILEIIKSGVNNSTGK